MERTMADSRTSRQSLVSDSNRGASDTWRSNVSAGEQLAETVRTTLGPKGLDKMLISSEGRIVVTNDGASILDRLDIEHPAAKLIVEVSDQQDASAGDGTTSAVVLAGELLSEAGSLLEKNVHPTKITEGYHLAASSAVELLSEQTVPVDVESDETLRSIARTVVTGKWDTSGTEFLARRAVEAVRAVEREDRIGFEKITRKTLPGGSFYDSEVIEGLVIDMEESSTDVVSPEARLPQQYRDVTVALIDEELSTDAPRGVGAVSPESYEEYDAFRAHELDVYDGYVEALVSVGTDVVFCQQSIDDPVRHRLAGEGILAVERTRRDELENLARATGAQPVVLEHLTPATVGHATSVERRTVGSKKIAVVSGFEEFDQVSLLFRGGTEHVAEETKRKLDDCLYVLKLAIEDRELLPGGGATEVALARELRAEAAEHPGKEQLAIDSFANALESIPRTLARSAGLNPVDALIELRNAQSAGRHTAGLNLETGTVADMDDLGVLEPRYVKQQSILSAAEATNMIVRIDDAVPVSDHDHDSHDHEHGPDGVVHSSDGYPWAVGHSMGHDHH